MKKLLEHSKYTETWTRAAANKYRRLFQECGRNKDGSQCVAETNPCHWINKTQIPKGKTATYNRSVTNIRTEKADPNQVQFIAGGNILNSTGEASPETTSIETAKLLINSTLSTKDVKFMAMDISNLYIQIDLNNYQYIHLQ